jgi:hypothetical protein
MIASSQGVPESPRTSADLSLSSIVIPSSSQAHQNEGSQARSVSGRSIKSNISRASERSLVLTSNIFSRLKGSFKSSTGLTARNVAVHNNKDYTERQSGGRNTERRNESESSYNTARS